MSLLKQVSIVLGFIFLILFVSIIGLSFNIIKDSSAKSLYENVQNSVTSTSLSITNAGVDEGTIKTVINAAFDNGNYEKIVFKNINDEIVYELKKDLIISDEIPHWFINIVDTGEISALASISEGWNVLGVLEIYADRAIYYNQTYSMFIKLLQSLAFSFVVLIIILSIFFNFILKPLRTINNQAKAVMNNEFILSTEQPFTDEFKTLTTSINSMVSKFEKMFQNTNEVLKTNKELLYFDEVTKINNRKYFILKANEYLDKDSSNNKGFIVSLSIKLDVINKTYGFIKTNEILFKLASKLKNSFNSDNDIVVRMNGSEFLALVPNAKEEDRQRIIKGLQEGTIEIIATDHAPHSKEEKDKPLDQAPSGITGIETSLALGVTELVEKGYLSMMQLLEKMTINPAKLYNMEQGRLQEGKPADVVLFDPEEEWEVKEYKSKATNSPFTGWKLKGKVKYTICDGKIIEL
jgi:diguanylate cyclase (GGDEF)-like protein